MSVIILILVSGSPERTISKVFGRITKNLFLMIFALNLMSSICWADKEFVRDQGYRWDPQLGACHRPNSNRLAMAYSEHFIGPCGRIDGMQLFSEAHENRGSNYTVQQFLGYMINKDKKDIPSDIKDKNPPFQISSIYPDVSGSEWRNLKLTKMDFTAVNLSGSTFYSNDFSQSNFRNAQFAGARFCGVNFSNSDLCGADFFNVRCGVDPVCSFNYELDGKPLPLKFAPLFKGARYCDKKTLPCGLNQLTDDQLKEIGMVKSENGQVGPPVVYGEMKVQGSEATVKAYQGREKAIAPENSNSRENDTTLGKPSSKEVH